MKTRLMTLVFSILALLIAVSNTAVAQTTLERFRNILVEGTAAFEQPVTMDSTLAVTGATTLTGALTTAGLFDLNGTADGLVLDADGDTTLSADTDDTINVEVGGADVAVVQDWGEGTITGSTTKHLVEILDTTNVMTGGTNSLAALNIDLGIGNSTGGTNEVHAVLIDSITQDAQNTESAVVVGTGWDIGLDVSGTPIDLDADNDTSITASTDDQIDIEINGADDFTFTANTFTAASGSIIALATGNNPLEYGSAGQEVVVGTSQITGTAVAAHSLTTVTFCLATLGEDPTAGGGDAAMVTTVVSANVCTLKAWQDDFVTAATETNVDVHWLVIGTP